MSAAELDGLLKQLAFRDKRQRFIPAALISAVVANFNDRSERGDPWTIEDFLLGGDGPKSKKEEMIEWLDALERGDYEEDPEAVALFKEQMKATFRMNDAGR